MSMSLRENITAVIETCFSETKDEIQDTAISRILELIRADHKIENCSEKPNNCEHITEDGVTCAKYPACDDCPDNPLNKVKGSERLVKGSEIPNNCEPKTYKINPKEPTNMPKCFDCEDFFTCDGQCDEVEDEPQAEEWHTWQDEQEYNDRWQTDCAWK